MCYRGTHYTRQQYHLLLPAYKYTSLSIGATAPPNTTQHVNHNNRLQVRRNRQPRSPHGTSYRQQSSSSKQSCMRVKTNTSILGRLIYPLNSIPPFTSLPPKRQTRRLHTRPNHPPRDPSHPHALLPRQRFAARRFCSQSCAHQTPVLALDRSCGCCERQLEPGYGEALEAGCRG